EWVETGASSDESFASGLVDLWPLMADLPDRRSRVHISRPWLVSSHFLLVRERQPDPGPNFTGRIGLMTQPPLYAPPVSEAYPAAEQVFFADPAALPLALCAGQVDATFLGGRAAMAGLHDKPPECASVPLRAIGIPSSALLMGVASTFEAAATADLLRDQI